MGLVPKICSFACDWSTMISFEMSFLCSFFLPWSSQWIHVLICSSPALSESVKCTLQPATNATNVFYKKHDEGQQTFFIDPLSSPEKCHCLLRLLLFTLPHAAHSAGIIFDRNLWISHVCDSRLARWHRLEQAGVGDYGLDPLGTDDGTDDQSDREKENQT